MRSALLVLAAAAVWVAGCTGEPSALQGQMPPGAVAGRWSIVAIGGPGRVGLGRKGLAVASDGAAHIAYRAGDSLYYTVVKDDRWQTERVAAGFVGDFRGIGADLALDANAQPVVTYGWRGCFHGKGVCTARKADDGSWQSQTISRKGNLGLYTAVAVGKVYRVLPREGGVPEEEAASAGVGAFEVEERTHVVYHDYKARDDLYYAVGTPDGWQITKIDFDPHAGFYCDLAVDDAGRPHVVYATVEGGYDGIDFATDDYIVDDLKYARYDGEQWRLDTIDTYGNVGTWPSICVDATGAAHVSYGGEHRIKYAVHREGTWTIRVVDEGEDVQTYTSLSLAGDGTPWVAYCRGRNLWLAHWSGSKWERELVDDSANVGAHCAIAIDPVGTLHIAYTDWQHRDLKYARRRP